MRSHHLAGHGSIVGSYLAHGGHVVNQHSAHYPQSAAESLGFPDGSRQLWIPIRELEAHSMMVETQSHWR